MVGGLVGGRVFESTGRQCVRLDTALLSGGGWWAEEWGKLV